MFTCSIAFNFAFSRHASPISFKKQQTHSIKGSAEWWDAEFLTVQNEHKCMLRFPRNPGSCTDLVLQIDFLICDQLLRPRNRCNISPLTVGTKVLFQMGQTVARLYVSGNIEQIMLAFFFPSPLHERACISGFSLQHCTGCGGNLMSFHETHSEAQPGKTGTVGGGGRRGDAARGAVYEEAITSWYCPKCGLHIIPEQVTSCSRIWTHGAIVTCLHAQGNILADPHKGWSMDSTARPKK